jgi:hypothetical protein
MAAPLPLPTEINRRIFDGLFPPVRLLAEAHAQREVYWRLAPDAKADVAMQREAEFVSALAEELRDKDADVQYLVAAACFGPFTGDQGKGRLAYLKGAGLDLTGAKEPDETLVQGADGTRPRRRRRGRVTLPPSCAGATADVTARRTVRRAA